MTNKSDQLDKLRALTGELIDHIHDHGYEIPDAFKGSLSRRDKREPDRKKKQQMTDEIYSALRKHFGRVKDRLLAHAGAKSDISSFIDSTLDWEDRDFILEITRLIQICGVGGVNLLKQKIGVGFDFTLTNAEVAKWAGQYAFNLAKDISKTTADALKKAVEGFITTPGQTMGDIVNALINNDLSPLGNQAIEDRAWNIATTEVTRAYSKGQQQGASDLKEKYPDVKVVKTWFTNADDRVCDLCFPLDGAEVLENENFYDIGNPAYEDGNPPRHVNCRCWIDYTTKING